MEKTNTNLLAPCGLYCGVCRVYIAHRDNNLKFKQELLPIYKAYGAKNVDDIACTSCLSDGIKFPFCRTCSIKECIKDKDIEGCRQCDEYPCNDLKEFQAAGAHRFELWVSHEQIVEMGYEKWMEEMKEYYSCSNCKTINSAYDFQCRSCGHEPSNQYLAKHGKEILKFLANQQAQLKKE